MMTILRHLKQRAHFLVLFDMETAQTTYHIIRHHPIPRVQALFYTEGHFVYRSIPYVHKWLPRCNINPPTPIRCKNSNAFLFLPHPWSRHNYIPRGEFYFDSWAFDKRSCSSISLPRLLAMLLTIHTLQKGRMIRTQPPTDN